MMDGATADGPPPNPEVDDTWVDEAGELSTWDGTQWVPFVDISDGGVPSIPFRVDKE